MLSDAVASLVSEEVLDLSCANKPIATAVESLEGRVRCEVADSAKPLAGAFQVLFATADRGEEVLESVL